MFVLGEPAFAAHGLLADRAGLVAVMAQIHVAVVAHTFCFLVTFLAVHHLNGQPIT